MPENKNALTEVVYYILLSLYSPLHGYGIMQNVMELSGGRVSLGPGTLYGAINTLLSKGWIAPVNSETGDIRMIYNNSARTSEIARLEELIKNGKAIAKGDL